MTDEELLTRYYEGDDLAFAELHRRYLAQLRAAAYRRLPRIAGRREAADELAAQALCGLPSHGNGQLGGGIRR
jgi:hypothetical protein